MASSPLPSSQDTDDIIRFPVLRQKQVDEDFSHGAANNRQTVFMFHQTFFVKNGVLKSLLPKFQHHLPVLFKY